jgi:hypothetical protein
METQAVVAGVVDTNAREARPDVIESGEFAFVRPFQGFGALPMDIRAALSLYCFQICGRIHQWRR